MIVDASVALKWLENEPLSPRADQLLPRDDLVAPTILDLEVGHVLTRQVRQRLIQPSQAERLWAEFTEAPVRRAAWRIHADAAFDLSLRLRATLTDCLYLALAIDIDDQLITADERFVRAVRAAQALHDRIVSLAEF